MFDVNDIMEMSEKHRVEKQEKNSEMFLKYVRENFMKETKEEISRLYTRDKAEAPFKLCRMKSGNFSIIDKSSERILFSSCDLHEAKVEFIVMQSITDGGMGTKIFEKAMNL